MTFTVENILKLERGLLPDGRAYYMPFDGEFEDFAAAIAISKVLCLNDAFNILDVLYPDNDNFTLQDAHDWYIRLGIYDSGSVPLADMKLAIAARYGRLEEAYYRQHAAYIQEQLHASGFNDCYIYENRFFVSGVWVTKTVSEVLGYAVGDADLDAFYLDEVELDSTYAAYGVTKIVQYIEESKDATFAIGTHLRSTFFIAGATITTFANVPANRKVELRQLLITLKQLQLVGYAFITYI